MSNTNVRNRLGRTAIAAVLALCSTRALAQEVPSTDPAPAATPAAAPPADAAADPLAPAAEVTATEQAPASAAVEASVATPTAAAKPATKAVKTAARRTAPTKFLQPATQTPAPVAQVPTSPEPMPAQVADDQTLATAEEPLTPQPEIAQVPEQSIPIFGAAGAGILALVGAGIAVRRRKRERDEDLAEPDWHDESHTGEIGADDYVEPAIAPAMTIHQPDLPSDFDRSPFGRHAEAAYGGPTSDNPSLSLKKRLKRAHAMDQRERRLGKVPSPAAAPHRLVQPASMSLSGNVTEVRRPEFQF